MKYIALAIIIFFLLSATQKPEQLPPKVNLRESKFLELKAKKEVNDKKLLPLRKFTLTLLNAREFKMLNHPRKSQDFYKMAAELKGDFGPNEITQPHYPGVLFKPIHLQEMFKSKQFDKILISINPFVLNQNEYKEWSIVYDVLNVKLRKTNVKKLFCNDHIHKDLLELHYETVLCHYLKEYLKDGINQKEDIHDVETYFFDHDLNKRFLFDAIRDLK